MSDRRVDDLRGLVARRYATDLTGVPEPPPVPPDAAATLARMLDHRVCRRYQDAAVPDDLLDLVLAATFSTPSKSDLQQCSVIVVADPAPRAAIGDLLPDMPWVANAPRFLLFCGDSRRIRGVSERAGTPFANDHLDAFLNAAADAAMHLATFVWAAEAVGLGTCPVSVVRNHIDEVAAIVELPDCVFPFAGMCVGWPSGEQRLSPRLPSAVTVHVDRYDDAEAPALIADYDRRRYGDWVPPEAGCDGVTRWGWSVDKARQVARRERDQLAGYLRTHGFRLD